MTTNSTHQQPRTAELARVTWHISSYSENGGGSCVEAGPLADGSARVAMRHSHYPHGTTLTYPTGEWHALLYAIHTGELDQD